MSVALVLTSLLAVTVLTEFFVISRLADEELSKVFLYVLLINSLTLPPATYGYYVSVTLIFSGLGSLFIIGILIILAESFLLRELLRRDYGEALTFSIAANFVTAILSFGLKHVFYAL